MTQEGGIIPFRRWSMESYPTWQYQEVNTEQEDDPQAAATDCGRVDLQVNWMHIL